MDEKYLRDRPYSIDAWEKSQRINYYQSLFTATGNAETVWYTKTGTDHDFAFVPNIRIFSAIHSVTRKVLKMRIGGIPPGWWDATVATYCPSRVV